MRSTMTRLPTLTTALAYTSVMTLKAVAKTLSSAKATPSIDAILAGRARVAQRKLTIADPLRAKTLACVSMMTTNPRIHAAVYQDMTATIVNTISMSAQMHPV